MSSQGYRTLNPMFIEEDTINGHKVDTNSREKLLILIPTRAGSELTYDHIGNHQQYLNKKIIL